MTQAANPFICGRVVDGDMFFGREQELLKLEAQIVDTVLPQCCAIVGETRSGKSSLIAQFMKRAETKLSQRGTDGRPEIIFLKFDMSVTFVSGSSEDFYRQFVNLVCHSLSDYKQFNHTIAEKAMNPQLPKAVAFSYISKFFDSVRESGFHLVVVLDEFDFTTELFKFDPLGWRLLRGLAYDNHGISYLTASRRPISRLEEDAGISSNFAGIFAETIRLGLFTDEEANTFVDQSVADLDFAWSEPERAAILHVSGNHPYCLQLSCFKLFSLKKQGRAPKELTEAVMIRLVHDEYESFFSTLETRLKRNELYHVLLNVAYGIPFPADPAMVEELVDLGYLQREEHDTNLLRPYSPMLEFFLNTREHEIPVIFELRQTEAVLRQLVDYTYRLHSGDAWLDTFVNQFPDMVVHWRERQTERAHNPFTSPRATNSLLDFALLHDLKYLIDRHWEWFTATFGSDRIKIDQLFAPLETAGDPSKRYQVIYSGHHESLKAHCNEITDLAQSWLALEAKNSAISVNTPPLAVTQTFEEFERHSVVVSTGHSQIIRAYQKRLGRWVAIKQPLLDTADDHEKRMASTLLLREAEILGPLSHPNICRVYTLVDNPLGLVMEWIDGQPLVTDPPWQVVDAIDIGIQIAHALQHAHENDIIHRDIKPKNVMLTTKGTAKLIDFDIARHLSQETLTINSNHPGTGPYSAPEQLSGNYGDLCPQSDIFSLGVSLYQLVTGKRPYYRDNRPENYPGKRFPSIDQAGLPDCFYELLQEMLRSTPHERIASATEVAERLHACKNALAQLS